MMKTVDYFHFLVNEIHSVIIATINEHGNPITCAIDLMDYDEDGLYFLTAKGKNFYMRCKKHPQLSLTGMKGVDTLSCIAISIQGEVKEIGKERLALLLEKNPYMNQIYPSEMSRQALTVFQIYKGNGEWFDLSKQPMERYTFSFGEVQEQNHGYEINGNCNGCGSCLRSCPQRCIDLTSLPALIQQEHCLHCGNCYEVCPNKAIERR